MTVPRQTRIAREIAALAHGKALFSLAPVLESLGPGRREAVYRSLASEYQGFDVVVLQLLGTSRGVRCPGGAHCHHEAARDR